MTMELEQKIGGLQKELAGVEKEQAALRLQPCRGDSDIRKKNAKIDELEIGRKQFSKKASWT
jgi:hypothetical protein